MKLNPMPVRRSIYLDHSATTATDPRVVEAMLPYFTQIYGDASAPYIFGIEAKKVVEDARERMARLLHCKASEIVFTSGGSMSNNLAIRSAAWQARKRGVGNRLITSAVEHEAVGKTVEQLAQVMGFEKVILPVDHAGLVSVEDLGRDGAALTSVMYANNEVGTIMPISELAAQAKAKQVYFHTDAVQAAGQLTLDVQALGIDMMTLTAHKFYGPKGVSALYVREGIDLLTAEEQETGTLNTALIVGMVKALELAHEEQSERVQHYQHLRDQLIEGVLSRISDVELTGHREKRLPSHASFVIDGVESNTLLMHLDTHGIAASSGSACKTGNPEPSSVLLAMGYTPKEASGSLRLTVGRNTSEADVDYTLDVLVAMVEKVRKLSREFVL